MSHSFERYNAFRVTVAVLALAAAVWSAAGHPELVALARAIGFALALVVVVVFGVRGRAVSPAFELFQLVLDVVLVSVLAEMTGGLRSFFALLYFPIVGAGAYLQRRSGALWAASFATLGFVCMLAVNADFRAPPPETLSAVYAEAMFRIFAFYLAALLLGQLEEQLARTGRQLTQERVSSRQLAQEHDTVLDRVPAAVLSTNAAGTITAVNPFGRAMLGDVRGQTLRELLPSEDDTWEERRADNQRWVCSRAALPGGGQVVVIEDVSELERMRQAAASAERLVAAGQMAAGMAHEIRNPLAGMSGALQLLREERPSPIVDLALSEAERLNRLVEDFLDLTRRPSIQRHPVDLGWICREVCEAFSHDPRFADRITARAHGDAPEVAVDADRIRQALWNLVLNGAQAMPRGGRIDVTLTDRPTEGVVEIAVADEGLGIPEADRERVFDPFFTTRNGGTGLGLLLVDQIVRGHGGQVAVLARADRSGTEMRVRIPREVRLAS